MRNYPGGHSSGVLPYLFRATWSKSVIQLSFLLALLVISLECSPTGPQLNSEYGPYTVFTDRFSEGCLAKQNMTISCGSVETRKFLIRGWSRPERDESGRSFVWATKSESSVLLPLERATHLYFSYRARPFRGSGLDVQRVTVLMNGKKVALHELKPDWGMYRARIPSAMTHAGNNIVTFQYSQLTSPAEVGLGRDTRKLAVCFSAIRYSPHDEEIVFEEVGYDVISAQETIINGVSEQVLFLPPTGKMTFRTLIPDQAFIRFTLALKLGPDGPDKPKSASPVRFQIIQKDSNSGTETIIFEERMSGIRERDITFANGFLISRPRFTQKLAQGGSLTTIIFRTEFDDPSRTQPVQAAFLSPTIVGHWHRLSHEETLEKAAQSTKKVVLLGLDGLTWDILNPMMSKGELPHLQQLVQEGFSAPFATLVPSKSPMLWTTIATGKRSEKHGITDYVSWDPQRNTRIPVTVNLRKTKAVWNMFSDLNKKVMVLGWWPSWPAERVNGYVVADRRGGAEIPQQTFPEDLWSTLQQNCLPEPFSFSRFFSLPLNLSTRQVGPYRLSEPEYRAIQNQLIRVYQKDTYFYNCARFLLEKQTCDLFALYINGVDPVCHLFWKYYQPELYNLSPKEAEPFAQIIPGYYRYVDEMVGALLSLIGPDSIVIVLSDHGFESEFQRNFKVNINRVFELAGMLHFNSRTGGIDHERTLVQRGPSIDASLDQRMIFSDRIKRDPQLLQEVKQRIQQVIDSVIAPRTGLKPFSVLWETGSDYDFVIQVDYRPILDEELRICSQTVSFNEIFPEDFVSGSHGSGPDGILIMRGPGIVQGKFPQLDPVEKRNTLLQKPNILDITPTILYLLGLPLGEDMDGRPYFQALSPNLLQTQPVQVIPSYDQVGTPLGTDHKPIVSQQDETIREHLRALGYIN